MTLAPSGIMTFSCAQACRARMSGPACSCTGVAIDRVRLCLVYALLLSVMCTSVPFRLCNLCGVTARKRSANSGPMRDSCAIHVTRERSIREAVATPDG
jgi:hypothetical protein